MSDSNPSTSSHSRLLALRTLALGAVGGGLAELAGVPAGWMTGALLCVFAAGRAGLAVPGAGALKLAAFTLLGYSIGAGIRPDTVGAIALWWPSLLGVPLVLVATIALLQPVFRRALGWDGASALYAAVPGSLTPSLVYASQTPADLGRVGGAHLTRLGLIATVFPLAVLGLASPEAVSPGVLESALESTREAAPALADPAPPIGFALALGASVLAGLWGDRWPLPAGALVASLLASALIHGSGLVAARAPDALVLASQALVGTYIGARLAESRRGLEWRSGLAGAAVLAVGLAVGAAVAVTLSPLVGRPALQLWLAYAPGGIEVMPILALSLEMDAAFVGLHQVLRAFAVIGLLAWLTPRHRRG